MQAKTPVNTPHDTTLTSSLHEDGLWEDQTIVPLQRGLSTIDGNIVLASIRVRIIVRKLAI